MPNIEEIIDVILEGSIDEELETLMRTIDQRREMVNKKKTLLIKPRDKVVFNSLARPRYLQGKIATVTRVNDKTVVVDMPEDWSLRRYSGSKGVRTPVSIVDKVEE